MKLLVIARPEDWGDIYAAATERVGAQAAAELSSFTDLGDITGTLSPLRSAVVDAPGTRFCLLERSSGMGFTALTFDPQESPSFVSDTYAQMGLVITSQP